MTAVPAARRALLGAALALTLPLAACGGSSDSSQGPDPAKAAPATAPIYASVTVRPDGELKDNTLAVAKKLLNTTDPGAEIKKLVDGEAGSQGVTYDKDIESWLGPRAGVFFTDLSTKSAEGALIVDSTDDGAAQKALDKAAASPSDDGSPAGPISSTKVDGVAVKTSDDTAYAVLDGYALLGSPSGVKAAIATIKGGASLADADTFKKATDALPDEDTNLGLAYVNVAGTVAAVSKGGQMEAKDALALRQVLNAAGISSIAASLGVQENAVGLDSAILTSKKAPDVGDPSKAMEGLPGDSWAAIGLGDIQASAQSALNQASNVGSLSGGLDLNTALEQLKTLVGVDIRKDLLSWMGPGAAFVRGTSIADIGAALVVESKDPSATKAAVPKIEQLLKLVAKDAGFKVRTLDAPGVDTGFSVNLGDRFPLPINVAAAGDKFIIAVTDSALQAAIKPSTTLGSNSAFKDATGQLSDGVKPAFYLNAPPLLDLAKGFGAGNSKDFAIAQPYLAKLAALVAGFGTDGDVQRQQLLLTLTK